MKVTIEADSSPLKRELDKSRQEVKKSTEAIRQETDKIKNPFQRIKDMVKGYQVKAGIKTETADYKAVKDNIEKTQAVLDKYYEKRDKMESLGVDQESRSWKSLEYDIKNAEAAVKRYEQSKANMEKNGTDVARPVSIPKQALNFGKGILSGTGKVLGSLGSGAISAVQKGWGGLTNAVNLFKKSVSAVEPVIRRTSGLFGALIQKFSTGIPVIGKLAGKIKGIGKSAQSSSGGLTGGLKTILKYTLGIRSLFTLTNKLRSALVDGFNNLAKYDTNTNASLSMLMSSLTQLKNSFATAFTPILEVVAPILNNLIQMIIRVVNSFGQLMGALTGKSTMVTAKKVNQDYAKSLDKNTKSANKASKAADKYKRTILGFDQINKLDDKTTNEKGSSLGGVDDMFETTAIQSKYKDLAKLIKDSWKNADFTELGAIVGRKINTALQSIPWNDIQNTVNKIAKSIATFLNGFIEATDWGLVGNTLAQGLNTAFGFANTFAENFHWGSLGTAIGNGINGALNGIDWELIYSTARNWGSGIAEALNNAISTTDWTLVGTTLANGINAIFLYAKSFAETFDWNGLGVAAGNGINGALSSLDWNLIRTTVSEITTGIVDTLNSFISTTDWGLVGRSFAQGINTIIDFAYAAVTTFNWKQFGMAVADFLNQSIETIDWAKAGQTISNAAKGILDFFIKGVENTDWKRLGEKVAEFLINIDWNGAVSRLFEAIGAAFGGLAAFIGGLFGDAVNSAKQYIIDHFTEAGKFTWEGFLNGIKDAVIGIGSWIKEHIFQPFIDGFKNAFGIHSPSTVMAEMGQYLMQGLQEGIKGLVGGVIDIFDGIRDTIGDVWDTITKAASTAWNGISTTVSGAWDGLKTTATEKFDSIKDTVSGTWEDIKTGASTIWEKITKTVGGVWDDLTGKSKRDFPSISGDAKGAFEEVNKTSEKEWKASAKSVTTALKDMKGDTWDTMKTVYLYIKRYWGYVSKETNKTWIKAAEKVADEIKNMVTSTEQGTNRIAQEFSGLGTKIQNSIGNLYNIGYNAAMSFANGFRSVHIPVPSLYISSWNTHRLYNGGWFQTPNFSVNWYANGGFPNIGELFMARENGPELVGRMGNKSAVANNGQIVDGIRAGVFEGMVNALESFSNNGNGQKMEVHVHLEGDSKKLFKMVRQEGQQYQRSTGKPVFS